MSPLRERRAQGQSERLRVPLVSLPSPTTSLVLRMCVCVRRVHAYKVIYSVQSITVGVHTAAAFFGRLLVFRSLFHGPLKTR